MSCSQLFGQICDPDTPVLTANLTGNPDSMWISPPIIREDHCCTATGNDRCLEIILTLDQGSQGIIFNVYSGAMPSGALYYQVNCGPPTPVGTQLCLSGPGPHIITFCKPGNNDNQFSIQAIPAPALPNALTLNDGCTGTLTTSGYVNGTLTWTSIAPGVPGQYNNYLSSTTGSTVTVTAQPGYPPYVDYQVCGIPVGGCYTQPVCLTTRVTFNPTLFAAITPLNPTVCFGSPGTSITANGAGGTPPYSYQWSNGATTQSIFVGPGTYSVIIQDATDCPPTTANVTVTQFTSEISATAGPDTIICIANPVAYLSGSVNAVTTGIWSGGSGIYNPGNTSLNTTYYPSQTEINNGFANLILTTTGNGTCPPKSDTVHIDILPFLGTPSATGSSVSCYGSTNGSATVSVNGSTTPYTYSWTTTPSQSGPTATGLAPGTYTVSITDGNGCPTRTTAIVTQPAPLTSTAVKTNTTCYLGSNGSATITGYGGTTPYTYAWSPSGGTGPTASNLAAGTYTGTVSDANGCTTTSTVIITQPAILTATIINKINVSCYGGNDGSATVSASGGTPGYTYSWSPSGGNNITATGLSAGSYFISVTDANGCQALANTNITQPAQALTATTTQVNVSCFNGTNGSATATPSGGTAPYTYSWSSGATSATASNLPAGTFNLTVTDSKGCTYSTVVTITQPLLLTSTISSSTNVSCFGGSNGSATVSVSGGTTPYTYTWTGTGNTSATATGLTAGTYTTVVTDNLGCSTSSTVIITQPVAPLSATTTQTNVSCNAGSNGTADVTVTGGTSPYTYSWSPSGGSAPNASGLAAGTYTASITDSKGCTLIKTVIITEPPVLTVTNLVSDVSCNGGADGSVTASVSGGTAPFTYSWTGSSSTTSVASGLTAGTYNVTVTDANGCTVSASSTVSQPPLLTGTTTSTNATVFGASNGTATVAPSGGTTPYTYSWSPSGGTTANATGLAAGTYTVTVTDAEGCVITLPVIITQPDPLVVTTTQVNVLCNGGNNGSIAATVSGGTTPFTYSWSPVAGSSPSITGLTAGTYTLSVTDANGGTAGTSVIITEPTILTSVNTEVPVNCFGASTGSATVNASGGITPYTYSWTPGGSTAATATGLAAGTYTVTVTDANGCIISGTSVITEPLAPLAVTISTTPVLCKNGADGTAAAVVSGGTAPYTYSWSSSASATSSASGFAAGAYVLQVTDSKGCILIESFQIQEPTLLVTTTNVINTLCGLANGQANVQVSGGVGAYTYSWSPSGGTGATATNLLAGTYYVTVTDANGCQMQDTAIIINNTPAINVTTTQTNVSCFNGNDGTAEATPQGGQSPYTYSWTSGSTTPATTGLIAGTYTITITDSNTCFATTTVAITQPAAPLTASTNVINHVSCNGGSDGSASVTAAGGTAPYTYSWSPSGGTGTTATGLSANTYSIYITDSKGCTFTATVVINQPTLLQATTTQGNVSCFGGTDGTTTVTPGGGTSPYTYSWSNGTTTPTTSSLSAGTYTATVTDNKGCQVIKTVIITEPALLTTVITSSNVLCNGESNGSATATVNGGTTPYTYSWSPAGGTGATATSLIAGTYTVSVTDVKGCISTSSVIITEPQILAGTLTSANVNCFAGSDGTAVISVTGGTTPYTYNWAPTGSTTPAAGNLSTGSYTVTVTDANACTIQDELFISEPAAPLAGTHTQTNVSCNSGNDGTASVTITGGTAPYTYSWSPAGGTGSNASSLTAGTYSLHVTDANGCTYIHNVVITEPPVLAVSTTNLVHVKCFGGNDGSVTSIVSGGTSPYTYSWSPAGGTSASATSLIAGTYTVSVTDSKGCPDTSTAIITEPLAPLSATTSQTNILCNGDTTGIAEVVPAGGTSPYTVSWFPFGGNQSIADSLTAGTYTATVTDTNNCQITRTFTITQNPAMVLTVIEEDATCGASNGSASVSVTGGTSPYTYLWNTTPPSTNDTITGLASTNYDVTITDANGCVKENMALIDNIAGPTATIYSITNVSCFGGNNGSATVTQSGGVPPYQYLWSNGDTTPTADSLPAGIHVVTVIDQNNCQGLTSTNPQITEPPQIFFQYTKVNVNCNGGNDGSATLTVSGGVKPYTYSWSPTGGTDSSATNLTAGSYLVTIIDGNGCDTSLTITITEPPLLTTSATSTNVSCFGGNDGTATVTAAGGTTFYTYSWTPSGGTSPNATGLTAGTYSVTVTDAHGCSSTSSTIITEPASGLTATTGQINVSCFGGSDASAWVITNGGTAPYAFSWSPNTSVNDTAFNLSQGIYTATITDDKGCTLSQVITIIQPTELLAGTSNLINTFCAQVNGEATATATGGTGPYTYSWSTGSSSPTITGLAAGTYTVVITDAMSCQDTAVAIITDTPGGTATITSTTHVSCYGGNNGTSTVTPAGGIPPYTFSWAPSGGSAATGINMIEGFYTVTVTDSKGCTATDTVTIKQPTLLRIEIDTIVNPSCNAYSDGYAVALGSGGTLPYVYSWSTTPSQANDTATSLSAGMYSVTVTDSLGCSATTNAYVTHPAPLVSQMQSYTNVTCYAKADGTATVFTSGGTAPFNYSWTTIPAQTTVTAVNLAPGTYDVNVTDAKGCLTTSSVTITQPDPLITTAVGPDSVCKGQSIVLEASATGGNGGYFYQWTPNLGLLNPVTVNPSSSITYYVVAFDSLGCAGTKDTLFVQVISLSPADVSLSAESPICPGASTTLTANINSTTTGTLTYSWNNGLSNQPSFTSTPSAPTTYVVTVTNSCGATVKDSIDVEFIELPTVNISTDMKDGCSPLTTKFADLITGNSTETITGWQWNFGDGSISDDEFPEHVFTGTGTYVVTLEVTTSSGCRQVSANGSPITVHPDPVAEFTASPTLVYVPRGNVTFVNTSSGAVSYEWEFGDGKSSDLETPPPHKYPDIGLYPILLTATNEFGCIDTTVHSIIATGEIKFPSAFTPDPNGSSGGSYDPRNLSNDVFFPRHAGVTEYHLQIFNRWGELIFESFDVNIGWDGYYRGELCKQDVYVWKAFARLNDGRTFNSVGDVTLLR